ncbi:MAG: N-acetyltransferase [Veillonella sp.]|nr:N-acetyltransferase [Veillonella sp.]MCF0155591.1 N-acetyltransferase [Veillonella sp.]
MARRREPVEIKIVAVETKNSGMIVATSKEDGNLAGQMSFAINNEHLITLKHTLVEGDYEGQGVAGKMADFLVGYARKHQYRVIAECSYVHAYFEKHSDEVADVWAR